jgi:hypothetical protein
VIRVTGCIWGITRFRSGDRDSYQNAPQRPCMIKSIVNPWRIRAMGNTQEKCDWNYQDVADKLLEYVPEFRSAYEKHMEDNFGEVLLHVLMYHFYRFLVYSYKRSISEATDSNVWQDIVTRSLNFLDCALGSSDNSVHNLVLSFLENMNVKEDVYYDIKALLLQRPRLQQAWKITR